jgi:hypothetical protein
VISKAVPIERVIFSFFGVCLIESSPINYKELSLSSSLNILMVPFGKGIPRP